MKQAIAGVAPPELGEVTIMTVWPSIGAYRLGRLVGHEPWLHQGLPRVSLRASGRRQDVAQREWELLNGDNPVNARDKELVLRQPQLEKARANLEAAKADLGPCLSGCAQGGKSSTDITYWPKAVRRGVELRTRCRVREVTVNDEGFADGVIYYDENGDECISLDEFSNHLGRKRGHGGNTHNVDNHLRHRQNLEIEAEK